MTRKPPSTTSAWVEAGEPGLADVLRSAAGIPRRVWRARELVAASVRRELAARLSGTLLGKLWPLVQPLLVFAIYWFVFTRLLGFRMPSLPPEQGAAMGVWMFTGVLVWTAFGEAVSRSAHAFVENGNLIRKVAFPVEVLPLEIVLASAATLGFGLIAYLAVCFLTPLWDAPGAGLLWIPLLLVLQIAFTTGVAWIVATAHALLRDTQHVVAAGITVWMFVTPVFWVPSPEVVPGIAEWLPWLRLNPMHDCLYAWRHALMSGEPAFAFADSPASAVLRFGLWSLASLCVGAFTLSAAQRRFSDEV